MQKNIWILSISSGTLALIMITILIIRNFKNRQRLNNSKQENIRLKALIDGEEKERNRIAQDLHDGIGGLLSAAKMSLSTAYPKLEPQLAQYTNGIKLLDEAYKDLRQTAHNLSPEILKHKGLWEAIRIYSEKIGHNKNLTINFETIGDLPLLHQETELSIYRILQELLQNIVKHAHASLAIVQISANDGILHIMVEDNGHGIVAKEQPNGIGLNSIHSRVEALEGRIDIDSRLAEGTTIYIEFSIHKLTQETHLADQVISAK
jgi:two-component system NarL family sensor kinase